MLRRKEENGRFMRDVHRMGKTIYLDITESNNTSYNRAFSSIG